MPHLCKEGIKLYYLEKGTGTKSYIFIHGTGANHQQLTPEFEYFSKLGRAVSIDLRGHGKSDKPLENYSLEQFANDISWICSKLNLRKVILIGASMGGNVSIEFAAEYPDLVSGLILLDSSLIYPPKFLSVLNSYSKKLNSSDYKECIIEIATNSCLETDRCKLLVQKMLLKTPQHVWQSCVSNMLKWDKAKVKKQIAKIKVPILYIEAHNRIADLKAFKNLSLNLTTAKVVGSGHLLSLEVPEQVNPMIERFVNLI